MKNRVPMITTCLIGAGLLAVAIFVSFEQKTLAQLPADPAHAAHVAAAANQAGGQNVEAQLAEILARLQRLEAITQQQPGQPPAAGAVPMGAGNPSRTRPMPRMEPGAKPMQGMAGMNTTGNKGGVGGGPAVTDQLAELRAKVQRLENTLQQQSGASFGTMPMQGGMAGMSGMGAPGGMKPAGGIASGAPPPVGGMGMMGMMEKMMSGMGGGAMPAGVPMGGAGSSGGMGMMDMDKMEMAGMMGMMGGMGSKGGSSMAMPSALPGFPGASHLYHLGATGFFLDHPQHIALSTEQQMRLNQIKQQAALDRASASRSVQEAEQDLWTLTAADQPDNGQIEAKVAEIEKLKGDARLRFIGTIGGAAKILTDEQRKILTGFAPPVSSAPMAGGMKGM